MLTNVKFRLLSVQSLVTNGNEMGAPFQRSTFFHKVCVYRDLLDCCGQKVCGNRFEKKAVACTE